MAAVSRITRRRDPHRPSSRTPEGCRTIAGGIAAGPWRQPTRRTIFLTPMG